MSKKILYFTDPHVVNYDDVDRFILLGRMIKKEKPDIIVCGGDIGDFNSFSFFDRPGTRTQKDRLVATVEFDAIRFCLDAMVKAAGIAWQRADTFLTEGNHEQRVTRWAESNWDVGSFVAKGWRADCGWGHFTNWCEYRKGFTIEGIRFTHMPHNCMSRPYSGVNICRTICMNSTYHYVFGHRHKLDFYTHALAEGSSKQRVALSAPAFMVQDYEPDWAKGNANGWTYGVTLMYTNDDPLRTFEYEFIGMERMESLYGDK